MLEEVAAWFRSRTFHAWPWTAEDLVDRLYEDGRRTRVSVVLPARNEQATVGAIVEMLVEDLIHQVPLVDEVVVMDSGSTDRTAAVATGAGARVVHVDTVAPELGVVRGKGDALWKSLLVTDSELLVFLDADLEDFTSRYVVGLLGPLLTDPAIQYVKATYDRPLTTSAGLAPAGGGRVTELLARPVLNAWWPELSGFVQPLSGEYAGRREVLERVPFVTGYGVEVGLLVDLVRLVGLDALAQVDLERRVHRHQSDQALGRMAGELLQALARRLPAGVPVPRTEIDQFVRGAGGSYDVVPWQLPIAERPPAIEVRRSTGAASSPRPGVAAPVAPVPAAPRGQGSVSSSTPVPPPVAPTQPAPEGVNGAGDGGPLTVLVNAGPWVPVPPPDYGGIENVVDTLVGALRRAGHRVVLATVSSSTAEADDVVSVFDDGQLPRLAGPYGDVVGIAHAHMQAVLDRVTSDPTIDVVHDHLEVVGAATLSSLPTPSPPVLQTLHWDLAKHRRFYETFDGRGRVAFAAVSESQLAHAPANLRRQTLGVVPLAAPVDRRPPEPPGDHLLTLGRLTPLKGYDIAARVCRRGGHRLVMAGPVGGFPDRDALDRAVATDDVVRGYRDVKHFFDDIEPSVDGDVVRWIGAVGGEAKDRLLRSARAVLFPLRWNEPGGTAIVEALLAGVPVVGFRRGVLPSLVDHGVTGFVVDTEDELAECLDRVGEIDRTTVWRMASARFAPEGMAAGYVRLYRDLIRRATTAADRALVRR
jgi:glycosyltransferase involved in cell wall biosynthesis